MPAKADPATEYRGGGETGVRTLGTGNAAARHQASARQWEKGVGKKGSESFSDSHSRRRCRRSQASAAQENHSDPFLQGQGRRRACAGRPRAPAGRGRGAASPSSGRPEGRQGMGYGPQYQAAWGQAAPVPNGGVAPGTRQGCRDLAKLISAFMSMLSRLGEVTSRTLASAGSSA